MQRLSSHGAGLGDILSEVETPTEPPTDPSPAQLVSFKAKTSLRRGEWPSLLQACLL